VLPHHQVVLGLITTKDGALENADELAARVEEATQYVPMERLAVSPQCGFASAEIASTMTLEDQDAKLRLVGDLARRIWA
jgi:5-methyltetrahydropteroyltriglutamate--homocysteine methyltransferase